MCYNFQGLAQDSRLLLGKQLLHFLYFFNTDMEVGPLDKLGAAHGSQLVAGAGVEERKCC